MPAWYAASVVVRTSRIVPFSPTRPPHAPAGAATTDTAASATAAVISDRRTPFTRRNPIGPPSGRRPHARGRTARLDERGSGSVPGVHHVACDDPSRGAHGDDRRPG